MKERNWTDGNLPIAWPKTNAHTVRNVRACALNQDTRLYLSYLFSKTRILWNRYNNHFRKRFSFDGKHIKVKRIDGIVHRFVEKQIEKIANPNEVAYFKAIPDSVWHHVKNDYLTINKQKRNRVSMRAKYHRQDLTLDAKDLHIDVQAKGLHIVRCNALNIDFRFRISGKKPKAAIDKIQLRLDKSGLRVIVYYKRELEIKRIITNDENVRVIGVDVGMYDTAVLSNGATYPNRCRQDKIKRENRIHAKMGEHTIKPVDNYRHKASLLAKKRSRALNRHSNLQHRVNRANTAYINQLEAHRQYHALLQKYEHAPHRWTTFDQRHIDDIIVTYGNDVSLPTYTDRQNKNAKRLAYYRGAHYEKHMSQMGRLKHDLMSQADAVVVENIGGKFTTDDDRLTPKGKSWHRSGYDQFNLMIGGLASSGHLVILQAPTDFASTQICNVCKETTGPQGTGSRQWVCTCCHEQLLRDVNAAANLKELGALHLAMLRLYHPEQCNHLTGVHPLFGDTHYSVDKRTRLFTIAA